MTLRPPADRIILKPIYEDSKITFGNLKLDRPNQRKMNRGEILMLGKNVESDLNIGDIVIYEPSMETEMEQNGEKVLMIEERFIWCILEEQI